MQAGAISSTGDQRRTATAILGALAGLASLAIATPAAGAATFATVPVGTFAAPVHVDNAPGEPELLFVVEKRGQVQVLQNEGPRAQPFLDIDHLVRSEPEDPGTGTEEGLFSIAFAPNYEQSRRFYVFFTNNKGDNEIDEFRRAPGNRFRADRQSRRRVLLIKHPIATNHNGGQLQFGPGGHLYFATGDGGGGTGVPFGERARDLNSLHGKLLRIDPLPQGEREYTIPNDNPYVGRPGLDEIYAYGLRNPFRFTFSNSRVAIGDVGAGTEEEVNILELADAAGVNFGWPEWEGTFHIDPTRPGPDPPVFPIHSYPHSPGGRCAVTGGYVVRDPGLPALRGRYLYGDLCSRQLRSFKPRVEMQVAEGDRVLDGVVVDLPTSFGEGFDNQIYVAQHSGGVFRLEQTSP